jgi:hypothetical protein
VHENYEIFLTISTFLFAIFTGFFISRQGTRYSQISDQIARFDGSLTSLYRSFSYLGSAMFKKAHNIIERHYDIILNKESWDYHFTHKSTTLTDLYALAATFAKSRKLPSAQHLALGRILNSLENLQITRKTMVSLHGERIPRLQWAFNIFLGSILLLTLSTIPAQGYFLGAALKASFATTVVFILVLLYRFDTLQFFENMTGESSARDVLNILEGKR